MIDHTEIKPTRRRVPQFAKHIGPQRYANHDSHPDLPFEGEGLVYDRADMIVAWGMGFAALALLGLDLWSLLQ